MKYTAFSMILSIGLAWGICSNAGAQDSDQDQTREPFKFNLGVGAGFTTGYGLSFRYMPSDFGAQVNFGPYTDGNSTTISSGLTFLFNLVETQKSTLYLYQANHFYYDEHAEYYYIGPGQHDPNNPPAQPVEPSEYTFVEQYFNNGLGFGLEVIIVERISLNFMAGYAAYRNFSQLNMTGETALYYKF